MDPVMQSDAGAGPAVSAQQCDRGLEKTGDEPKADAMTVEVRAIACTGGERRVRFSSTASGDDIKAAVAEQFKVPVTAIDLTVKALSLDSPAGLAAVRAGCPITVVPHARSGLETTRLKSTTRVSVNQEEICGLLEALEGDNESVNPKISIVFSTENGKIGEAHLTANEAAKYIRASLSNGGDATSAAAMAVAAAQSRSLSTAKQESTNSTSLAHSAASLPAHRDDMSENEQRCRMEIALRQRAKEMEVRKGENSRMVRILDNIEQARLSKKAKRDRRLRRLAEKRASSAGKVVPAATKPILGFGSMQKGFLCK